MAAAHSLPFGNVPVAAAMPFTTGTYFFVDSVNGSDGNSGRKPDRAFATVQKAIDSCTANAYDMVICLPGHAETVTATSIAMNKAGVQVVGIGHGTLRPTFTYGAAAATVTVSAANCSWSNTLNSAHFANVVSAFTLTTAKHFRLETNTFIDESSSLNFLCIVTTNSTANASDGLRVLGNVVTGLATTDGAVISILGNITRFVANDNVVNKAATNNAGHFLTAAALVMLDAQILRNYLTVIGATNASAGIFLTSTATTDTGIVAYNLVASLDTSAALIASASTGLQYFENYVTGLIDKSGILWPTADDVS